MAKYKPRSGFSENQIFTLYESHWRRNGLIEFGSWKSFDDFLIWAKESGFRAQSRLRRIRTSLPYGPDNCYWDYPESEPRQYPKGHPCGQCQMEAQCNTPCPERLRYWDASMAMLRPVFSAAHQRKEENHS